MDITGRRDPGTAVVLREGHGEGAIFNADVTLLDEPVMCSCVSIEEGIVAENSSGILEGVGRILAKRGRLARLERLGGERVASSEAEMSSPAKPELAATGGGGGAGSRNITGRSTDMAN